MKHLIEWNKKEIEILSSLGVPFDFLEPMSKDDLDELYFITGENLCRGQFGFGSDGEPNPPTVILEDITDKLIKFM